MAIVRWSLGPRGRGSPHSVPAWQGWVSLCHLRHLKMRNTKGIKYVLWLLHIYLDSYSPLYKMTPCQISHGGRSDKYHIIFLKFCSVENKRISSSICNRVIICVCVCVRARVESSFALNIIFNHPNSWYNEDNYKMPIRIPPSFLDFCLVGCFSAEG